MIHIHQGINALGAFKTKSLQVKLTQAQPGLSLLGAEYIHFTDLNADLGEDKSEQLTQLLSYEESLNIDDAISSIIIIPRLGTISPWSSKATDIMHCVT